MMKQILIAFLVLSIASCKKTTTQTPTPSNPNPAPQVAYHDLPNWRNDTLKGYTGEWDTANSRPAYEIILATSNGGKGYITYQGVQYYLRAYVPTIQGKPIYNFSDSVNQYYCDLFDMSGNPINNATDSTIDIIVEPYRKWNKNYKTWDTSAQTILLPFPPFNKKVPIWIGK